VLAWVLIIAVEVETVLITGPCITVLSLVMIVAAVQRRYRGAWLLGLSHCAICAFFVILVNVFRWDPSDAMRPFTVLGLAYVVLAAPLSYRALWSRPPIDNAGACRNCGYPLTGLRDQRCPECGVEFEIEEAETKVAAAD
jgi:hypothetical protein